MEKIINNFVDEKVIINKDPKNKSFSLKLKSLLNKETDDSEIKKIISLNNDKFQEAIKNQFLKQRRERIDFLGEEQNAEIEKRIFIQTLDMNWRSHLQYLEQLRQVIGLRSYGQKDPLIEYKKEAFQLFENLLEKIKFEVITILNNLNIVEKPKEENKKLNNDKTKKNIINNPNCLLLLKKNQKISRNERCNVTGKKFKQCCGAL